MLYFLSFLDLFQRCTILELRVEDRRLDYRLTLRHRFAYPECTLPAGQRLSRCDWCFNETVQAQIELHLRTRGRGRGRRTLMACLNNVTPAKILLIISSIADGI